MGHYKKLVTALLAGAVMLSLFARLPLTAQAADADSMTFQINHQYNHGGSGNLSATQSVDIVIVTGAVTNATESMILNIDSGVKVI